MKGEQGEVGRKGPLGDLPDELMGNFSNISFIGTKTCVLMRISI